MEQLSSCYFCGTALDEPLGTYRLGTDGPGGRVTLCPTCHEKLETVLGAAGVESGVLSEESTPASHAGTAGEEAGETGGEADEQTDDEADSGAVDDNPVRTIVGGETDEDGDEETVDEETVDEETVDEEPAGESEDAPGEPVPEAMDADDILVDLGDDDALGDDGDGDDSAPRDDGATEDDSAPTGNEEPGQAETEADTSGGFEPLEPADDGSTEEDDSDGDRSGAGASDRTISKGEFNKVMRLLQNREFPVDRMEILTVATGAYDLRQPEVDQAIDLAIDRGVIDEDEEQLVRPE